MKRQLMFIIERLNTVKRPALFNFIHRLNAVPIKIQQGFFGVGIDVLILKFMWRGKRPSIINTR